MKYLTGYNLDYIYIFLTCYRLKWTELDLFTKYTCLPLVFLMT